MALTIFIRTHNLLPHTKQQAYIPSPSQTRETEGQTGPKRGHKYLLPGLTVDSIIWEKLGPQTQ